MKRKKNFYLSSISRVCDCVVVCGFETMLVVGSLMLETVTVMDSHGLCRLLLFFEFFLIVFLQVSLCVCVGGKLWVFECKVGCDELLCLCEFLAVEIVPFFCVLCRLFIVPGFLLGFVERCREICIWIGWKEMFLFLSLCCRWGQFGLKRDIP